MSTDQKSINWYNSNAVAYTNHVRNKYESVFHSLYEKPAMYGLVPGLKGKSVISLGCGSGEDINYLKNLGAQKVLGIDISQGMIEIAKKSYSEIEFKVMDMEKLELENESFDFAYSSLAIHYIENWTKVFQETFRVLKNGSYFLFSCEHPLRTSLKIMENSDHAKSEQLAINTHGNSVEIIGDYLNRHKCIDTFSVSNSVTTWHKSISEIISEAKQAGFLVESFLEPMPLEEMKSISPLNYEILCKIPEFMIFRMLKL